MIWYQQWLFRVMILITWTSILLFPLYNYKNIPSNGDFWIYSILSRILVFSAFYIVVTSQMYFWIQVIKIITRKVVPDISYRSWHLQDEEYLWSDDFSIIMCPNEVIRAKTNFGREVLIEVYYQNRVGFSQFWPFSPPLKW